MIIYRNEYTQNCYKGQYFSLKQSRRIISVCKYTNYVKAGPWTLLEVVTYLTTAQPEVHTYTKVKRTEGKKGFQIALKHPACHVFIFVFLIV